MFSYFKNRKTNYFDVFSKLQYRNENQNYISNFIFQFIKKNEIALWVHGLKSFILQEMKDSNLSDKKCTQENVQHEDS